MISDRRVIFLSVVAKFVILYSKLFSLRLDYYSLLIAPTMYASRSLSRADLALAMYASSCLSRSSLLTGGPWEWKRLPPPRPRPRPRLLLLLPAPPPSLARDMVLPAQARLPPKGCWRRRNDGAAFQYGAERTECCPVNMSLEWPSVSGFRINGREVTKRSMEMTLWATRPNEQIR